MEGQKHLNFEKEGEYSYFCWKTKGYFNRSKDILSFQEMLYWKQKTKQWEQNTKDNHRRTGRWEVACTMRPAAGPVRRADMWLEVIRARSHPCVIPSSFSGTKGSFSLSLTFTSRLAPDPSLVVYAIFPSGGIIADKVQFSVEMCFDNQVKWQLRKVKKRSGHRERACVWCGWKSGRGREIRRSHWSGCHYCIHVFSTLCWIYLPLLFKKLCWEIAQFFLSSFCLLTFFIFFELFN